MNLEQQESELAGDHAVWTTSTPNGFGKRFGKSTKFNSPHWRDRCVDKIPQQLKWGWLKHCNACVFLTFLLMLLAAEARGNSSCSGLRPKNSPFQEAKGPKEMDMDLPLTKCFKLTTLSTCEVVLLGLQL